MFFSNFWKHDQTSINLTNIYIYIYILTLFANFRITLGLMKSNGCVALLNLLHLDLQQCHNLCQWVDLNSI